LTLWAYALMFTKKKKKKFNYELPIQWLLSKVDDAVLMISRQCLMLTFERDQPQRLFSTTGL
jgi:hypothetical protein